MNLREQLSSHKLTLNLAIAAANYITTMTTRVSVEQLEYGVRELRHSLTRLLPVLESIERCQERDVILQNYHTTIQSFSRGADSIMTAPTIERPPSPSLAVSTIMPSVETSSTYFTTQSPSTFGIIPSVSSQSTYETAVAVQMISGNSSYKTAPSTFDSRDSCQVVPGLVHVFQHPSNITSISEETNGCYQVFVSGLGKSTYVVDVPSRNTSIEDLRRNVTNKAGVPMGLVRLSFNGRVLLDDVRSVDDFNIPHNATLRAHLNVMYAGKLFDERGMEEEYSPWFQPEPQARRAWPPWSTSRPSSSIRSDVHSAGWYSQREASSRKRYMEYLRQSLASPGLFIRRSG